MIEAESNIWYKWYEHHGLKSILFNITVGFGLLFSNPVSAQVEATIMGNTLYLTGDVGEDMVFAIRNNDMRGVNSIAITSHGGSIGYGIALSNFVGRVNLAVIVTDYCESACTLILAGARKRIGSKNARFLIHGAADGKTASADGKVASVSDSVKMSNDMMKAVYILQGVDRTFVDWAVQTPRAGHERYLSSSDAMNIGLLTTLSN